MLYRIERYLRRTGMPPTRFGREVVKDPRFVFDLRRGRQPQLRTRRRVIAWLAEHAGDRRA